MLHRVYIFFTILKIIKILTTPDDWIEPEVGRSSNIKLKSPVKIVATDQAGFQVSGWKSEIERHNLI